MEIRFASIPKCGSRTLGAQALLGEADPDWKHSPIRAYPEWERFHWMAIERDPASWYPSYWAELVRARRLGEADPFVAALGLRLESLKEDMRILDRPPMVGPVPRCYGVNGWVPPDFDSRYADARARGLDFYGFCREVVVDGVPCENLPLESLDAWLVARGLPPEHNNART